MKINQDELLPHVLKKIQEVNDEAGYRSHLEVPEIVNIVCEILEKNNNIVYLVYERVFHVHSVHSTRQGAMDAIARRALLEFEESYPDGIADEHLREQVMQNIKKQYYITSELIWE